MDNLAGAGVARELLASATMRRALFSITSLAATSLVGLVGCGHSLSYTATNAPPRPLSPRAPATVEVFVMDRPSRPHVEVGLFEIAQQTPSGSTPEMIEKLRARAGQVGCDAIWVARRVHRRVGRSHFASCIAYTDAPPTAVASAEVTL